MSSQIVGPTTHVAEAQQEEVVARREVAVLVEDAVVRQVALAVDAPHLAVGEHEARVVEVGVEVRRADERGDPVRRLRDLVDRPPRRADEAGAEQQVLRRVAGDDELGEEDEVGVRLAGLSEPLDDAGGVAVEVADDAIDLCECESHRSPDPRSNPTPALVQRSAPPADVEAEADEEDGEAQPADPRRVGLVADDADHGGERQHADQPETKSASTAYCGPVWR